MNKTEQLSTSTQNPKIELPNKTLVGVKPTEKKFIWVNRRWFDLILI